MIWLGIYVTGVVVALALHGVFGGWQDDGLGVFYALIWPALIPIAALFLVIKVTRFIAEGALASVDRSPEGEKPQALNAKHESAVPEGQTPSTKSGAPDNG